MPVTESDLRQGRMAIARAERQGDPQRVESTRRDYAAEKLQAAIEKIVAEAPPLTGEQRTRLSALLMGGSR